MEFKGFTKIARLSRNIVITEKLDGTNGMICIGDNKEFFIGSKNKWITPEDDNYGFAKWCYEHKDDLLKLGKGYHYGEWWGGGIQRGYGLEKGNKRFSLFNVTRWCLFGELPKVLVNPNPKIPPKTQDILPQCCSLVPVLYEGNFDTDIIDLALDNLKLNGSYAVKGYDKPEGIIIYHKAGNICFKKTIEKDNEAKSNETIRKAV